jgi:hypothetical protein
MISKRRVDTSAGQRKYQKTKKVRKAMYKTYLRWSKYERVYPQKKSKLKKMTLSKNQQEAISMFSFDPVLTSKKLVDLKSRRAISDEQLDKLQEYLFAKQKALEDAINNNNKYEFNGQTYYTIDSSILP